MQLACILLFDDQHPPSNRESNALMDAILTLVSILGLGALIISVYIFAVAARRFVSEDDYEQYAARADWVPRSGQDRRQNSRPPEWSLGDCSDVGLASMGCRRR